MFHLIDINLTPQAIGMEVFCIVLIIFSLLFNIFLLKEMCRTSALISEILIDLNDKIYVVQTDIDVLDSKISESFELLSSASKAPPEPMKSLKPNNWNSMRAAFKGPTRVDIDE